VSKNLVNDFLRSGIGYATMEDMLVMSLILAWTKVLRTLLTSEMSLAISVPTGLSALDVTSFFHQCGQILNSNQSILWVLFVGGLTGSVGHCLTMCSGFVLSQVATSGEGVWARLLLPYHLGRIVTYSFLGLLAGSTFGLIAHFEWFSMVSRVMLGMVAVIFIFMFFEKLSSLFNLGFRLPFRLGGLPGCSFSLIRRLSQSPTIWHRVGLGMVLGLLPCGLVFAGLMAVAAKGSGVLGFAGMAAFGAGTIPALAALSLGGSQIIKNLPKWQDILAITAFGANGLILLALAAG